jgi:hypothetical protein
VTQAAPDFTAGQLLARRWTRRRLLDFAEGHEQVARITPGNPSAVGRAAQLREIAGAARLRTAVASLKRPRPDRASGRGPGPSGSEQPVPDVPRVL